MERDLAKKRFPVVDPAVWRGREIEARSDWLHHLSDTEIQGLLTMARDVRQKFGDDPNALLSTTAADFDLGAFEKTLTEVRA